jgi:cytochrome c oxidase subunit 2
MRTLHPIGWPASAVVAALLAGTATADWELNMPKGVTETSRDVYDLHMLILWVCVVIGVLVYGVMVWALVNHRKSKGVTPATFSHSTNAEIIWTIIPAIILVVMAVPSAAVLVRMEDTRDSELTIKVTGYQWKWHYQYLDEDVAFYSNLAATSNAARLLDSGIDPFSVPNYLLEVDAPVVVPVDTKVRILLTAADVIHAWWMPDFAVKKDAIPGYINEAWFQVDKIGTYRGQCAELCGKDHGFMPIVVEVTSRAAYEAWLEDQRNEDQS